MKLFTKCSSGSADIPKLTIIGFIMLVVASLVILCDPLQKIIDWQLSLSNGTLLYNLWLRPPLEVFLTVYIFNITNLEGFVRGADEKLKLAEVGPYVYQEILVNHNVTFNANNTVSYTPKRTLKFVRERSVGDPTVDKLTVPNIPYMGATSAASSFSAFAAIAVNALIRKMNAKTTVEVTVHDYLWGYEDHFVTLASKILPGVINFQKFGLMDRMLDEGDNVLTMKLPVKKTSRHSIDANDIRDFAIDNWNGNKGLAAWDYREEENNTVCNTLRGSYDGTLFPRDIQPDETFRVYRKAFCRTLPIVYKSSGTFNGIKGYNFKLRDDAFDTTLNDSETSCYCKNNACLKKGLASIRPCYYNIPLAISFPHFLNADPSLSLPFDGLQPLEAKHGTEVVIQPQLGIPMIVHSRFQANMLMYDVKYIRDMAPFQNMVLPLLWIDIGIDSLTPNLELLVKALFNICPYVQNGFIIGLIIAGGYYIVLAFLLCFRMPPLWTSLHAMVPSGEYRAAVELTTTKMSNVCNMPSLKQPSNTQLMKHIQKAKMTKQEMAQTKECDATTLLPLYRNAKEYILV